MATLITYGSETTSPDLVLGYETSVEKPVTVHNIIGRQGPDVTLRPASARAGTLELFYSAEDDASYAVDLLLRIGTFTLTDTDWPSIAMTFVVSRVSSRLEASSWVVSAEYQEVLA